MLVEIKSPQIDAANKSSDTKLHPLRKNSLTTTITATITATVPEDNVYATLSKTFPNRFVTFKPRTSHLDRETMDASKNPLRGFFVLFWLAMAVYVIQTIVHNLESLGTIVDLSFFELFSKDAVVLALSDACMVGATFFDVILQKMIARGWIEWRYTGMAIQHLYQVTFLFSASYWTYYRGWPWVQSGFFVLHTIAMLMKIHSYAYYNGDMSAFAHRLRVLRKEYSQLLGETKKSEDGDEEKEKIRQQRLSRLRAWIEEIENIIKNTSGSTSYPDNLTFANFLDYLLVPTLVYELEYPRTEKIRPRYVFEKALATLGTFFLLYMNTETYIIPVLPNSSTSFWRALLQISIPFMVNYLLIFYIIFECICNVFAELTRFADRHFYDDWWNSTTFEEFARKWNRPVHHFLLRHVYQWSIDSYKLSRRDASLMTFLLSSLIHELVMIVVSKKIRMYLFLLQMFQLPLIWVGNLPAVKESKWLGNAFFWFSMMCGPPLLGILYCNEVFAL
uniref:O-acyltransferase n=1 Tax=Anthurium amnicola TaxID=1678845 RepID=A0A1D1XNN8_9ARAE